MRDYMDRRAVIPPKRVTSPTWGPQLLCKHTLKRQVLKIEGGATKNSFSRETSLWLNILTVFYNT